MCLIFQIKIEAILFIIGMHFKYIFHFSKLQIKKNKIINEQYGKPNTKLRRINRFKIRK